jgi:hypothetical protein
MSMSSFGGTLDAAVRMIFFAGSRVPGLSCDEIEHDLELRFGTPDPKIVLGTRNI